jgi:RsiW-degrading membrane proteinase PrsW (M82 family)
MAMLNYFSSVFQNPQVLLVAFLGGTIPAVIWLLFWLREDKDNPEPFSLLTITFISGMLGVILVLPIEKWISTLPFDSTVLTYLWAASEEILKYLAFAVILTNSPRLSKPVDFPIYLMTAGLGFAALENTFYLLHPILTNNMTLSLLTGNLRFIGSTLLHSATSGIVGISIGLAFFQSSGARTFNGIIGLITAIILHGTFNFFIIVKGGENFLQVFGFLWVITIIIMLLFEKLRRMGTYVTNTNYLQTEPGYQ